ncbi:MAG: hypothetical protein ACXW39_01840, partial [Nitrospira sp.]
GDGESPAVRLEAHLTFRPPADIILVMIDITAETAQEIITANRPRLPFEQIDRRDNGCLIRSTRS